VTHFGGSVTSATDKSEQYKQNDFVRHYLVLVVAQFKNQILHFIQDDNSTSVILSSRLCENYLGALRRSSGRTDKYSIAHETSPFVVSLVEP